MIITALFAVLFIFMQAEVAGVAFFVLLMSALLIICDDVLTTTLPFLAVCVMVLQCYDSFDTFIKFIYVAPIPVGAVIFHFIYYRQKFKVGKTLWGILAVSVAVTLGGIGAITAEEYFAGMSLYYIAALGFGMAGVYMLIKSQLSIPRDYDVKEKFVDIMYIMGLLACAQMLIIYYETITPNLISFTGFIKNPDPSDFKSMIRFAFFFDGDPRISYRLQPSNNICTFLMIALPFPFYKALKNEKITSKLHLLSAFLMVLCIFISKSRGGWIMGGLALVLCLAFAFIYEKNIVWKCLFALVPAAVAVGAFAILFSGKLEGIITKLIEDGLVSSEEPRVKLLIRSFEDFKNNPLFGQGIGNTSNFDIYAGKEGTMVWYHMMIPQIYGGMGIVGIIAYAYQFVGRVKLPISKYSLYVTTLLLSYGGLFLMSQVNPGEFCPIPYALIAVIIFIMMENEPDIIKKSKKNKKQSLD